jgi:hypothetical protein
MIKRLLNLVVYDAKHEIDDLIVRIELGGNHCPSMEEILSKLQECAEGIGAQCQGCVELEQQLTDMELQLAAYEELLLDNELL